MQLFISLAAFGKCEEVTPNPTIQVLDYELACYEDLIAEIGLPGPSFGELNYVILV